VSEKAESVQPNYSITNLETKQIASLDGNLIVNYGEDTIQLTGYNLVQIIKEKLNNTPTAESVNSRKHSSYFALY
jgi:hypothetical protein